MSSRYPHFGPRVEDGLHTGLRSVAGEGILFTNAYVRFAGCRPCRRPCSPAAILGRSSTAGTHASSFSPQYLTFPDLLEMSGYFVGYTGKGWGPGKWEASGRDIRPVLSLRARKRSSVQRRFPQAPVTNIF